MRTRTILAIGLASVAVLSVAVPSASRAQGRGQGAAPPRPMGFFVTSVGIGRGGDLGGLAGADAHCVALASAAGAGGRTWRAYLSTHARPGQPAVNARDRIGAGPWYNAKGGLISQHQSQLHGDTLIEAQRGSNLFKQFALTEKGELVNGVGDPIPNRHDILTGSHTDGRAFADGPDRTCNNWTSSTTGTAQVGHSDRIGNGNTSWNSSHATTGCSQEDFASWGGAGLFYCFAAN